MSYTLEEVRDLFGTRVPNLSKAIPAAWWITTDPTQLAAYDQWVADYDAHRDKIGALAQTLGLTADDAYSSRFHTSDTLIGFRVKAEWTRWPSEKGYEPVPAGWRIESKKDYLVPSRKTKADREGQIVKDFATVKDIPCLAAYVTGMAPEIYLDDRGFGGTSYRMQYRRGENCVGAFCNGDPDRQPEKRMNDAIDETVWLRQKLSVLLALAEEQAEKVNA